MAYPISYGVSRLAGYIDGPTMHIWLVDSIAVWWLPSRSTTAFVAVMEDIFGVRISSALVNCAVGNTGLMTFTDYTSGTGAFERCENANSWALDNSDFFALPVQIGSIDGAAGVTLGSAITGAFLRTLAWEWNDTYLASYGNSSWLREGSENMSFRPLYVKNSPATQLPSSTRLYDENLNTTGNMALRTDGRPFWSDGGNPLSGTPATPVDDHVNAWYQDFEVTGNTNPDKVVLCYSTSLTLASRVFGGMCYRTGAATDGYGMIVIGDSSWDYSFHGDNTATSGGTKRYTNDQARRLLDQCVLSRSQKYLIHVHCAGEDKTKAAIKARIQGDGGSNQGILVKYRAILDAIGITDYRFCLWGCWRQHFGGALEDADAINDANNEAMHEIAQEEDDVAFVSMNKVLGGQLFMEDDAANSSGFGVVPSGTQAASKAWLASAGGTNFVLGSLGPYDFTDGADFDGVLISDGTHQGTSGSGSANAIAAFIMHRALTHMYGVLHPVESPRFRSGRLSRISRVRR